MIFALLFIVAFMVGFGIYASTRNWRLATLVPSLIYVGSVVADQTEGANTLMSFIFGLPIVFVAALLGCYIFVLRFGSDDLDQQTEDNSESSAQNTAKGTAEGKEEETEREPNENQMRP